MPDQPPQAGFCVWLTGLSGAGKTTTAVALAARLEAARRTVTLLDGDLVRAQLSSDLGFSPMDRDTNVRRIAFVAREIVRHGGAVVVAAISPYRGARREARQTIGSQEFLEVFVDTPQEICEARDVKGLYGRARRGEITSFTGIDDPYEPPEGPDLLLDGASTSPDLNAERIVQLLRARNLLRVEPA